jgi:hypothetical protein
MRCCCDAQAFAWLARSKHVFRHMTEAHFMFVMLRLMKLRNKFLLDNPYKRVCACCG